MKTKYRIKKHIHDGSKFRENIWTYYIEIGEYKKLFWIFGYYTWKPFIEKKWNNARIYD